MTSCAPGRRHGPRPWLRPSGLDFVTEIPRKACNGGLIAAALGVKFGKGILAVALVFLKKFWFVLLIVPAAIWKYITGRRGKDAEA